MLCNGITMGKSKCRLVGKDVVCGGARSGAGISKKGVYRLHKGEKVLSKGNVDKVLKMAGSAGHCRKCMMAGKKN
jgi:hypothetical protein